MSQEEIFRKYMSETAQAKKKAKNQRNNISNMRIIDNEVSMKSIPYGDRQEKEYGEDAPQFVAPSAPVGASKWKTGFTTVGFTDVTGPSNDAASGGAAAAQRGGGRRHDSDSDESPVRKDEKDSDSSDSDASPPRKRTFTEAPRKFSETPRESSKKKKKKKKRKKRGSSNSESSGSSSDSDESPKRKPGLQTATQLREKLAKMKEFAEKKRREQEGEFKIQEAPVRRDAHGSKIDMILEQAKESAENEEERKKLEKFMMYSKGIVQHKENLMKKADNEYEMSKPLARYAQDDDYNNLLKGAVRADDPMNAFSEKKKKKKKKKKSKKSKKKKKKHSSSGSESDSSSGSDASYSGPPAPPNRFGIAPGPKWDGVDRSNGYEKLLFMKQAEKLALKQEQYKYSTAYDL